MLEDGICEIRQLLRDLREDSQSQDIHAGGSQDLAATELCEIECDQLGIVSLRKKPRKGVDGSLRRETTRYTSGTSFNHSGCGRNPPER